MTLNKGSTKSFQYSLKNINSFKEIVKKCIRTFLYTFTSTNIKKKKKLKNHSPLYLTSSANYILAKSYS